MARKTHKKIEHVGVPQNRALLLWMPKDLYMFYQVEAKRLAAKYGTPKKPFRASEVILAVLAAYHDKRAILALQITPDD